MPCCISSLATRIFPPATFSQFENPAQLSFFHFVAQGKTKTIHNNLFAGILEHQKDVSRVTTAHFYIL